MVVEKKINVINDKSQFKSFCQSKLENFKIHKSETGRRISSTQYSLRGCDLNDTEALKKIIQDEGLDLNAPTLILTECVMVYLEPMSTRNLIRFFSNTFDECIYMDYEMFNPFSNFGKMMVKNFKKRGVPLIGMDNFHSLPQIEKMYIEEGFTIVDIHSMQDIFMNFIPKAEMQRIRKLEMLDEVEELFLIQEHYFISIAHKMSSKLKELGSEENSSTYWLYSICFESIKN